MMDLLMLFNWLDEQAKKLPKPADVDVRLVGRNMPDYHADRQPVRLLITFNWKTRDATGAARTAVYSRSFARLELLAAQPEGLEKMLAGFIDATRAKMAETPAKAADSNTPPEPPIAV